MWFLLVSGILMAIVIIAMVYAATKGKAREEERKKAREYYQLNYKHYNAGMEAKKPETVQKHLEILEAGYSNVSSYLSDNDKKCYQDDIDDLREYLSDLEVEKWIDKADVILEKFLSLYCLIMESDFRDVEKAQRSLKQCLNTTIHIGNLPGSRVIKVGIQPCKNVYGMKLANTLFLPLALIKALRFGEMDAMHHRKEQINRQLTQRIEQMRPEYKRKMQIFDDILGCVSKGRNCNFERIFRQFERKIRRLSSAEARRFKSLI